MPDDTPPVLIPRPRSLRWSGEAVPVGGLLVEDPPAALTGHREELDRLLGLVGRAGTGPVVPVRFTVAPAPPEGYQLITGAEQVQIVAADARGALHAARTLVDLWDAGDGRLPVVAVDDAPTFAVRGIFAESFAGTDRMTLADWQQLVDRLAALKLNTLGLAIYGCWQLGYEQERTEYLFLPLADYPQLATPQRLVTWDPGSESEAELRYLPRMYEEDFFGDLVRYAAQRGVEVIPQLGGPGHSTLLPRLVPELSAWDEDGQPTGYGYCVTRPPALSALADLVRSLVRQQLRPAGVTRLHVAADEYYPIRNIDPADLRRVVSPYCRCPQCRRLSAGEQLAAYLRHLGGVLAAEGIEMVHWQDTLVREQVLDDYLDAVATDGIPTPVIAWWKYNDPVPVADAGQAPTWVCPTVGLFAPLFGQDFTPNIETTIRRGDAAGATGVFAYTMPHPDDHANLACLADLSWHLAGSGGAGGFWQRYAAAVCPQEPAQAHHAFSSARTITASYPLMLYVLDHLLPYFSTAAAGVTRYPDDLLRAFSIPQPGLADVLRQVRDTMRDAVASAPAGRDLRHWPDPMGRWRRQCLRLADSLDLFLAVLAAARQPQATPEQAAALAGQGRDLLRRVAAGTPAYLAPAVLREHWTFVREIEPALARLRADPSVAGAESWYAWIV